jgi:hypothetical protein
MKFSLRKWYLPLARGHGTEVDMGRYASTEELPITSRAMNTFSSISLLEPPTSVPDGVPPQYTPPSSSTSSSSRGSSYSYSSSQIDLRFPTPTLAELTDALDGLTHTSIPGSEHHRRTNNLHIPPERRHGAIYPDGVIFSTGYSNAYSNSTCGIAVIPPVYPNNAPERRRARRVRRPATHRPENYASDDPPPGYAALDPYPYLNAESTHRLSVITTIRNDGLKVTTGKMRRSVVRHVEDVGKIAKNVPAAVKDAQVKLKTKRAKDKIRWLEKNEYLSGQDRFLTRALTYDDQRSQ